MPLARTSPKKQRLQVERLQAFKRKHAKKAPDALQRLDYADFRANTCARDAGKEADVLDRQRNSVAAKGARYVGNVTDVSISGETASAVVTYYFEHNRDDKTDVRTAIVREDGAWRVCTAGPG